ncbi:MAG: type II toxin-antitoxin system prevent-host-death family antitoxin [Betaproteobacteria bacterium]|nr:type II toxin-antitoxin system prevent-host-death family antitoxin [Betaproteobacteria bacterium]MCL2886611.1 type II toxin-antitoxin system prevent-host-death family antitoxin [Betaproteobacteria bacterium]
MLMLNVHEAKARLSDMLSKVEAGETVIIARRNRPVAKLVQTTDEPAKKEPRRMGTAKGRIAIPPSFFEPLDDRALGLFTGEPLAPEDPLNPDWQPKP